MEGLKGILENCMRQHGLIWNDGLLGKQRAQESGKMMLETYEPEKMIPHQEKSIYKCKLRESSLLPMNESILGHYTIS